MFSPGEIVFVKITGEQVLILGYDADTGMCKTRQGQQAKIGGINYQTIAFDQLELESFPEKLEREMSEAKILAQMHRQLQQENTKTFDATAGEVVN